VRAANEFQICALALYEQRIKREAKLAGFTSQDGSILFCCFWVLVTLDRMQSGRVLLHPFS